ncbi:ThiF family adenylyltransferase [Niallia endozanthoxylica]|uniref:ThiF family adenylyltransferase n=1 Tax=Niallia endozanthoxylica TaxID=2036016 RepID=A0A5J5GX55_9BACI|nr:ThiF family adenylyltransferase [Niallia endozanthoxylica]KAA9012840.1 ThiF family adenylyltransferase [Niallia endozanthoxylica]
MKMEQLDVVQSFILSMELILPKYMEEYEIEKVKEDTVQITDSYGFEMLFIISERFPAVAPTILVTAEGQTDQVQTLWDLEIRDVTERMDKMISQFLVPPGPYRKAFGINGFVFNQDFEGSKEAWPVIYTGRNESKEMNNFRNQMLSRVPERLANELKDKVVLIVGAGSVGSYIAEQFARNGVECFIFIDPDSVELTNLSRTMYTLHDIGMSKVSALSRRLMNINPAVQIEGYAIRIEDFQTHEFSQVVERADLIIAATDDMNTQYHINRFSYAKDKACLFVGLYNGAKGGEVIMTIPEVTACYRCAAPNRINGARDTDYGTGRLNGVVAINSDIHHVSSAGVKLGLAILSCNSKGLELRNFLMKLLEKNYSYLTMSMEDNYLYFPRIFKEVEGQYAYQSYWISPERNPECPICGNQEHRLCPDDIPLTAPETSSL